MEIKELQSQVAELLEVKGFLSKYDTIRDVISSEISERVANEVLGFYIGALLATEPAEYIDAVKKGKGLEAELEEAADTIIRALNVFILNNADAETAIRAKMEKNFNRPHLYGHATAKEQAD